jgi:transcriptional regulator with XRE-family HTH domain
MNCKNFIEKFKASGMSMGELSKISGVNISTISRIIDGEKLNVTGDTIKALESALGLKKGDLL